MRKCLKADFFELFKSKYLLLVLGIAAGLGVFLPAMYLGLIEGVKYLGSLDFMKEDPTFGALIGTFDVFNGKTVFLTSLPFTQGFGLVLTAMLGFKAVRPFGTGVYRNKVIAGVPRAGIYLSQSVICLIVSMLSMAVYTCTVALAARLMFGDLGLDGRGFAVVFILSFGIYLVYTAIPVFIAFLSRSTPLTLIVSILLPVLAQTLMSIVGAALMSAPKAVVAAIAAVPSIQVLFLQTGQADDAVLIVALVADILWTALFTCIGIARFRKTDMN